MRGPTVKFEGLQILSDEEHWTKDAECQGTDTKYFFGIVTGSGKGSHSTDENNRLLAMGKQICSYCTVQKECLAWAIHTNSRHGTFGGLTERERIKYLRRHHAEKSLLGPIPGSKNFV